MKGLDLSLALNDCFISSQRGLGSWIPLSMGKGHWETSPTKKPTQKHRLFYFSQILRASAGCNVVKRTMFVFSLGKPMDMLLGNVF
jgi:hypothetical protein